VNQKTILYKFTRKCIQLNNKKKWRWFIKTQLRVANYLRLIYLTINY